MNKLLMIMFVALAGLQGSANPPKVVEANGKISTQLKYLGSQSICKNGKWEADNMKAFGVGISFGLACLSKDDVFKKTTVVINGRAIVAPWGEGKAEVILRLDSSNNCATAQTKFTGIEMSSGAYELYAPNQSEAFGKVLVLSESVIFDFPNGLTLKTTGRKGTDCFWTLKPDVAVELIIKK